MTLIQLLLASAISTILILAVMTLFIAGLRLAENEKVNSELFQSATVAMNYMERQIRAATDIIYAQDASIRFKAFENGVEKEIEFSRSGNELSKEMAGSGSLLASDIADLEFTYYDNSGNSPVADMDKIKFVAIHLTAQRGTHEVVLATTVERRNWKPPSSP